MTKILGVTYIWHGNPAWEQVLIDKPEMVIINPGSGPGGQKQQEIADLVRRLKAFGIKVLGYVPLSWTARPVADVIDEANRYKLWYGVDGIFWDEAPTSSGALSYLRNVHGFARGTKKTGISVFNPGVAPPQVTLYTFMISLPGSIWVTFEGTESDYYQQQPKTMFYMDRQAHIVYAANLGVARSIMAANKVGWKFVTPDTLPNPFDTWPDRWYN